MSKKIYILWFGQTLSWTGSAMSFFAIGVWIFETTGKATYHKGWKWSDDVSPLSGTEFCETEHLGMVISGNATVAFENEEPKVIGPGDIFYVSDTPHDSWVVGDEDYVSIHFMGAEKYAD